MSALRMATLWESRLSTTSTSSPSPTITPPRAESPTRRKKARKPTVSANKPPMAPPFAAGAALLFVQEVPVSLPPPILDAMSPVSSFVSSTALNSPPPSPGLSDSNDPHSDWLAISEQVQQLRNQIESWDYRIADLERRHHLLTDLLDTVYLCAAPS